MQNLPPASAIERRSGRPAPSGFVAGVLAVALFATCQRDREPRERAGQKPAAHEHTGQQDAPEQAPPEHDHGADGKAPAAPSGLNPVQHEMRLLHEALLGAVTAVGNGDVRDVAKSLHVVHGAKEQTEAALRAGTYTPPKNGHALARFIELDEEFHDRLYSLVAKSKENDVAGAAAALGKVLEACHGCHTEFRF